MDAFCPSPAGISRAVASISRRPAGVMSHMGQSRISSGGISKHGRRLSLCPGPETYVQAILGAMSGYDIAVSIALGIGLAAATGLRVFLPLLLASVAAYTGHLHLNDNFAWLSSLPAVIMLAIAAVTEVLAYYIPAVDNLLDAITTPVAIIAGALIAAAT